MNGIGDRLPLLFALLLGLTPAFAMAAQDIVATPDPSTAPIGVLAEFDIEELPAPHTEVWFLRFQLEPGGLIPDGSNPGPAVLFVEVGTLEIISDGSVVPSDTTVDSTEELTLEPGDSVLVPRDVSIEARNAGDEPTRFLMLVMFSGMDEGQGEQTSEDPVGMTSTGVAVGVAEFQPVPASVTMERVVVEPGDSMQNISMPAGEMGPGWMGIDVGTIETGTADVLFERTSFENMIWPPFAPDQFSEPMQLEFTATGTMEQGDGYSAFGSVLTFTNTGDEPLTILRVIVGPRMGE